MPQNEYQSTTPSFLLFAPLFALCSTSGLLCEALLNIHMWLRRLVVIHSVSLQVRRLPRAPHGGITKDRAFHGVGRIGALTYYWIKYFYSFIQYDERYSAVFISRLVVTGTQWGFIKTSVPDARVVAPGIFVEKMSSTRDILFLSYCLRLPFIFEWLLWPHRV